MKKFNNFIDEKLKLNKNTKIISTNESNVGWKEVQAEQGKNWYYNTLVANPVYKYGVIHINSDYEGISLMTFDNYLQMCKELGMDGIDADLDYLDKFDMIKTDSGIYIKIWENK